MADLCSGWLRLGALGALLALATCRLEPEQADYTQRFPIEAKPETVTWSPNAAANSGAALDTLVADYLDRGHGRLTIAAAGPQLQAMRARLIAAGVPASAIQPASAYRPGTVALSYVRYSVAAPNCGTDWSAPMNFNPSNADVPTFGCAQQHNLGLMLADPADIARMRAAEPSDAQNTGRVIGAYRAGNVTSAKQGGIQDSADQNVATGTNAGASTPLPTSTR